MKKGQDYGVYLFTKKELRREVISYFLLDAVISMLFYRSVIAFVLFAPGLKIYLKLRKKELIRKRKAQMLKEFMTGMQLVNASLQAGYAVENSFREAVPQLLKMYPEDAFILKEFRWILSSISLNVPVESILIDLGNRTHIDDIRNFAEVFQTAKRTGGDLIAIIRGAVTSIQSKTETKEEIEASISGKVTEQKIMSAAPLFLIAYTTVSSPGFLDVCYHNLLGITVMTGCLILYGAAFLMGKKIMSIEVT